MIPPVPVTPIQPSIQTPSIQGATSANNTSSSGFSNFLSQAFNQANQLSNTADNMSAQYAAGAPVSVQQVMIAQQKASLALELVVQVRDRAVSAYQSIMNMQI
ncbi:flagellar hook-basal body complex protein FliE [Alicyclobacillus mengziensis]|uniref:Flagellar hook-basal body complex protein FliE n=1 Tax=Alicyclobacillus mengziensis TaxID=2931921 RepID=A0A9X7Z9E4_9BACL|nr:flagellar hook-basal body complex protein FliE [Alicyclobacillus mengziensis]QSO49565.1 flagellar hook-basal body complex protein FliE [Alicyclobacillus mengziensis]